MYDFWYDYVKSKHGEKAKLCMVQTRIETRFDASNYEFRQTTTNRKKNWNNEK